MLLVGRPGRPRPIFPLEEEPWRNYGIFIQLQGVIRPIPAPTHKAGRKMYIQELIPKLMLRFFPHLAYPCLNGSDLKDSCTLWYGKVWYNIFQYGVVWKIEVSCGMVQVWHGIVRQGMVWYGKVVCVVEWYSGGSKPYIPLSSPSPHTRHLYGLPTPPTRLLSSMTDTITKYI